MNYCALRIRWIMGIVILMFVLTVWPVFGQSISLPRAKSPQTLFSFEGPESISKWYGLKCELTDKHFSDGNQALSFTIPKYETGADKWPLVAIRYDEGNGYKVKDWSHYGKIALDVWTDSLENCDLYIALSTLGKSKKNEWSYRFNVKPGQKNTIIAEIPEINESVDTTNIQQIILFASTPSHGYNLTVDNFRLLPDDKLSLVDFDLVYPNYRETIFPDGKDIRLSVNLRPEEYNSKASDYIVKAVLKAGRLRISRRIRFQSNSVLLSIPVPKISSGSFNLKADIIRRKTGKVVSTKTWSLNKVSAAQASSINVYIDSNNNSIVNGKPFFPLGLYGGFTPSWTESEADEIADSPFNCMLYYSMNNMSKPLMLRYLDKLNSKGIKAIYSINDVYPSATTFNNYSWEGIKGNEQITSAVVNTYKNHPALLAWYLNDEISKYSVSQMTEHYWRIRRADPNHPCYIVLCTMPELKYMIGTTDVMGTDPYPIPENPIDRVSNWTDSAQSAVRGHKPVWMVLQAFAWYQHHSDNTDKARIPTEDELKTGRAPTYEESRCMTYLALTHGAKGIIYWCYFDMKVLPQYKEMWGWMKQIGSEVKTLSPMLLSSEDCGSVKCTKSSVNIHTKLKKYNGEYYLMAVNAGNDACQVTFNIGKKVSGEAKVMFENRTVKLGGSQLTDSFTPLEVHVYNLGK